MLFMITTKNPLPLVGNVIFLDLKSFTNHQKALVNKSQIFQTLYEILQEVIF